MTDVASISVAPNIDNASVDITLAALPSGATSVEVYKKTDTGYDSLVHTFTGAGSYNDDNGGSGYGIYSIVRYVAVSIGTPNAPPSRDVFAQVGTSTIYTMAAHLQAVKDLIDNDVEIVNFHTEVDQDLPPNPHRRSIYVVPGLEIPDIRYATGLMENQLPVFCYVCIQSPSRVTGKAMLKTICDRLKKIFDLNYRWDEKCYDSNVNSVDYNIKAEGSQPNFRIAQVSMTSFAKNVKYLPVP